MAQLHCKVGCNEASPTRLGRTLEQRFELRLPANFITELRKELVVHCRVILIFGMDLWDIRKVAILKPAARWVTGATAEHADKEQNERVACEKLWVATWNVQLFWVL